MKFLIVDDSKAMQKIVFRALVSSGYSDHEFEYAGDGIEAIEKVRGCIPDMILCDWHMPNMNGIEFLKELKNLSLPAPIGFVTTERSKDNVEEAIANGALFVVTKPFTAEKLHDAIEEAFTKVNQEVQPESKPIFTHDFSHFDLTHTLTQLLSDTSIVTNCDGQVDIDTPPFIVALLGNQKSKKNHYIILLDLKASNAIGASLQKLSQSDLEVFVQNQMIPNGALDGCKQFLTLLIKEHLEDAIGINALHMIHKPSEKLGKLISGSAASLRSFRIDIDHYGDGTISILNTTK